jgi:site-specific DNA recombinase
MTTTATATQRVLGAVRQSKTRDRAVSPEAQRKRIQSWTDANGGRVVKFTFDLSVSGATSAFNRKGLGPWLTEPDKAETWDTLVCTKLDRACRDTRDYLKLRDWCKDHGKRFVILNNPELDDGTPGGKAMGTVTAAFAEFEREMAKERNKERYDALTEMGRWTGGRLPYGYRYNREARELEQDTSGTADVLKQMVEMTIAGKSQGQIAEWLNSHGHLTVINRRWRTDTVRRVLRSQKTMDLIGDAKAAQLRAALRAREQTRGERINGHMLLRVAFCRQCDAPLYCQVKRDRPSGGYYKCHACQTHIRKDRLEQFAESALLDAAGSRKLVKMELVPGDDHQAEIHALERDIDALEKITGTDIVVRVKQTEIEHLRALPFDPDHYVPVPQGITVAEHWATLDDAGKGSFMRTWGVTVKADRSGADLHTGWLTADDAW